LTKIPSSLSQHESKPTRAGSGANRRGPGHHERSGPDQDRDDVLRAGPNLSVPNPDCPTAADCTAHPAALTRPVFFISTYGFSDSIIASPATERAFFLSTSVHAALGIILTSDGKPADHTSIENPPAGNSGGEFGYATAWLEYQLRGNPIAAAAFTGPHPELVTNTNWPGRATK
jgi:hypothetical protein